MPLLKKNVKGTFYGTHFFYAEFHKWTSAMSFVVDVQLVRNCVALPVLQ
jgi:hypothetical protein